MNWGIVVRTMLFSLAIAVQGVHFRANAMQSNKPLKIMGTSDAAVIAEVLVDHFDELTGVEMQHCLDVLKKENNSDLYDQAYLMIKDNEKYKEFLAADERKKTEVLAPVLGEAKQGQVKYVEKSPEQPKEGIRLSRKVHFSEEAFSRGNRTGKAISHALNKFMSSLDRLSLKETLHGLDSVLPSMTAQQMAECLIEAAKRHGSFFENVLRKIRDDSRAFKKLCREYPQYGSSGSASVTLREGSQGPSSGPSYWSSVVQAPMGRKPSATLAQGLESQERQELDPLIRTQLAAFMVSLGSGCLDNILRGFYKLFAYMTVSQLDQTLWWLSKLDKQAFLNALGEIREDKIIFSALCSKYPKYAKYDDSKGKSMEPSQPISERGLHFSPEVLANDNETGAPNGSPLTSEQFNTFIRLLKSSNLNAIPPELDKIFLSMTLQQMAEFLSVATSCKFGSFAKTLDSIRNKLQYGSPESTPVASQERAQGQSSFSELRSKYPEYAASSQSVPSAEEARFLSGGVTFDRLEKLMQDNPTLYDSVVQRLRSSGELERLNLVTAVDRLDRVRDEMIRLAVGAGRAELAEPKRMSGSRNLTEEGE